MPKTLTAFINELATKAGIATTEQKLVDLLAHTELNRITIPDELETSFNQSLLSVADAKNDHPVIKQHYFGEIMSNVDRALKKVYEANDDIFDDDVVAELNKETSSTKRIAKVAEKLKEKLKAAPPTDDKDKTALQKQIDDLNEKLRVEKESTVQKLKEKDEKFTKHLVDSDINTRLATRKTIYDNLPGDAKLAALRTLAEVEAQKLGLKYEVDPATNKTILKKADGSNYYDDNNKLVDLDGFIDRTLSANKVLSNATDDKNKNRRDANANNLHDDDSNRRRVPENIDGNDGNKNKPFGNVRSLTSAARESLKNGNVIKGE
jgi:hypothetical protein